ncbi:MAG TPA: xanthine dehydrogenase family protein molybdopterin-binding subunit [bacterium]|nr:xanthine dehydrogenase family protein molybdopterin-binding subunit [bacterium]
MRYTGVPLRRREDRPLLVGAGRFIDDIRLPGMLHMAVVRSPQAHAYLAGIAPDDALAAPGVVAVITAKDLPAPAPRIGVPPVFPGLDSVTHPLLADQAVRYAGEPVAVVLARSRYEAEDAAERVRVRFEVLPPVMDLDAAIAPGAPVLHVGRTSNLVFAHDAGGGDPGAAFRRAAVVVDLTMEQPRLAAVPLECRGAVAAHDRVADRTEVWLSTQTPHVARAQIARILHVPPTRVRVVAPDVGGGFGSKGSLYPEEVLVAYLARRLGRPVKWVEDRIENLKSTTHGRGQRARVRAAAAEDGTVLAVDADVLVDLGAYCLFATASIPARTPLVGLGAYRIPNFRYRIRGVVTTKAPTGPYRGAGRPEAAYYIERVMDVLAARLGLDPAEIRRRNFITTFPHTSPTGLTHDSGDYRALLDRALTLAGYARWRAEQARRRAAGGPPIGIGLSTWIEVAGGGELWESGAVRLDASGRVTVLTGSSPHGQGLETAFSQIAADALGIAPERVTVLHGDTDAVPLGVGTFASRSLAIGGSAVFAAAAQLREQIVALAARRLEAAPQDIVLAGGTATVRGAPGRAVALAELAKAAETADILEASVRFASERSMVPSGAHVAVVEVDREIGAVKVLQYTAVDDCGRLINPLLVRGQAHGSVAQGLAQALFEQVVYGGEDGQLLTGTLLDYPVPTAADLPAITWEYIESLSPLNPLGAKGAGESGTIGAPPAIANAVEDALRPSAAGRLALPLTPDRVWRASRGAQA